MFSRPGAQQVAPPFSVIQRRCPAALGKTLGPVAMEMAQASLKSRVIFLVMSKACCHADSSTFQMFG